MSRLATVTERAAPDIVPVAWVARDIAAVEERLAVLRAELSRVAESAAAAEGGLAIARLEPALRTWLHVNFEQFADDLRAALERELQSGRAEADQQLEMLAADVLPALISWRAPEPIGDDLLIDVAAAEAAEATSFETTGGNDEREWISAFGRHGGLSKRFEALLLEEPPQAPVALETARDFWAEDQPSLVRRSLLRLLGTTLCQGAVAVLAMACVLAFVG